MDGTPSTKIDLQGPATWPDVAPNKKQCPNTRTTDNPDKGGRGDSCIEPKKGSGNVRTHASIGGNMMKLATMMTMVNTHHNISALQTTSDPDTMYYHQAMKAHNRKTFSDAIQCELNQHEENQTYALIKCEDLPINARLLPIVWQMQRKRNLLAG